MPGVAYDEPQGLRDPNPNDEPQPPHGFAPERQPTATANKGRATAIIMNLFMASISPLSDKIKFSMARLRVTQL